MKCNPRSGDSLGGAGRERFFGFHLGPILATTPQNAMKAHGGHQIVAKTLRTKTEHGDELFQTRWPARIIGVTRICAMDVRAERTVGTRRILGHK